MWKKISNVCLVMLVVMSFLMTPALVGVSSVEARGRSGGGSTPSPSPTPDDDVYEEDPYKGNRRSYVNQDWNKYSYVRLDDRTDSRYYYVTYPLISGSATKYEELNTHYNTASRDATMDAQRAIGTTVTAEASISTRFVPDSVIEYTTGFSASASTQTTIGAGLSVPTGRTGFIFMKGGYDFEHGRAIQYDSTRNGIDQVNGGVESYTIAEPRSVYFRTHDALGEYESFYNYAVETGRYGRRIINDNRFNKSFVVINSYRTYNYWEGINAALPSREAGRLTRDIEDASYDLIREDWFPAFRYR